MEDTHKPVEQIPYFTASIAMLKLYAKQMVTQAGNSYNVLSVPLKDSDGIEKITDHKITRLEMVGYVSRVNVESFYIDFVLNDSTGAIPFKKFYSSKEAMYEESSDEIDNVGIKIRDSSLVRVLADIHWDRTQPNRIDYLIAVKIGIFASEASQELDEDGNEQTENIIEGIGSFGKSKVAQYYFYSHYCNIITSFGSAFGKIPAEILGEKSDSVFKMLKGCRDIVAEQAAIPDKVTKTFNNLILHKIRSHANSDGRDYPKKDAPEGNNGLASKLGTPDGHARKSAISSLLSSNLESRGARKVVAVPTFNLDAMDEDDDAATDRKKVSNNDFFDDDDDDDNDESTNKKKKKSHQSQEEPDTEIEYDFDNLSSRDMLKEDLIEEEVEVAQKPKTNTKSKKAEEEEDEGEKQEKRKSRLKKKQIVSDDDDDEEMPEVKEKESLIDSEADHMEDKQEEEEETEGAGDDDNASDEESKKDDPQEGETDEADPNPIENADNDDNNNSDSEEEKQDSDRE